MVVQRTTANYLTWRFSRAHKKGLLPNVRLAAAGPALILEPGEVAVASIALQNWNGTEPTEAVLLVTDRRVLRDGAELIRWSDVVRYHWVDRDISRLGELRSTRFQRIVLVARDGSVTVLDGLGQAVLPLLQFLKWSGLVGG